jgi:hypothetical protein
VLGISWPAEHLSRKTLLHDVIEFGSWLIRRLTS